MANIELSFLTVNYRTPDLVNNLVSSIKAYPPPMPYEIIVVDNDSGDDSVDRLKKAHHDITLLCLTENLGFGGGNNRGAEQASGRIIILINSDSEILEESYKAPVDYLDRNPEVGIIGTKVITPEGMLEQTARGFPDPSTGLFGRSTFLGKLAQKTGLGKSDAARKNLLVDPDRTDPYEVDWVAGTSMVIRRECWDALGGFDEDYFMYWEDADLCHRALKKGYKTVYFPGSYIHHVAGGSTKRDPAPAIRWFHESAYKYVAKHISPGPSLLRGFAWCALNLRAKLLIARAKKNSKT